MKLLNLGCGAERPQEPIWTNLDNLYAVFSDPITQPSRANLDKEQNYVNYDLMKKSLPFADNTFDGVLASHLLEHFDAQDSIELVRDCRRILKPEGVLRVSVPDPGKFLKQTIAGTEDWGETNHWGPGLFMENALFFIEHKQVLSETAVECIFWVAGFRVIRKVKYHESAIMKLSMLDNRPNFSIFLEAVK